MRARWRRHDRRVPFGRTAIVLEAVVALLVVGYLLSHEAFTLPVGTSHYTIRAAFPDAAGLKSSSHSPVTVAGVSLGRVTDVRYEDGLAIATLELPSSVRGKVHDDARVRIIPRSALQDLMVDVTPGSAGEPALPAGTTIPPARTSTTVGLDRFVGVLDADTRAQVQILLGQLSGGLAGRAGSLRASLSQLSKLVGSATGVTRQLARRRALLTSLVGGLDAMATELGDRGQDLADVVDAGQRTLSVTAARDAQLADTVRALPATLTDVSAAMRAIRGLAPSLDPALERLRPFARRLPGALRALRAFSPTGRGLAVDLRALATRGAAPVRSLRATLATLGPAASALRTPVADLHTILAAIDKNKTGIGELGDNFSGVFSTNDANGTILRGLGFFEPFDPANFGFPANASGAQLRAAKLDTVRALERVCLNDNAAACLARYLVPGLPGAVVPTPGATG